ncbi:MAG TPA: tRNA pseudouridine(38-40) synthase TruA [Candidatus Acidoferrales bacterium]|nr:tRNA pseudouridine(38-40) synthase TruA [Candidatus Acidoferrales bacterium]
MRNLKLTLAYDGSGFHGWQIQPGRPTIQGTLAEVIAGLTGEQVLPQGSGRTDAGVHALAQIATFQTASRIPVENFKVVLNDRLPPTIRVLAVQEMPEGFHARHSAIGKSYQYRVYRADPVPPFLHRLVTHYPYPLNEEAMKQAATLVQGEHDFTSFAAVDPDRTQRMQAADVDDAPKYVGNTRTIYSSHFERRGDELVYEVSGNGFLHHMVRNLVGAFLLVGKGTLSPQDIPRILAERNRSVAGPTAPPEGLYLVSVQYPE